VRAASVVFDAREYIRASSNCQPFLLTEPWRNDVSQNLKYRRQISKNILAMLEKKHPGRGNRTWLSEETGISKSVISSYLTGNRSPDDDNLAKIASALGMTADEIRYLHVSEGYSETTRSFVSNNKIEDNIKGNPILLEWEHPLPVVGYIAADDIGGRVEMSEESGVAVGQSRFLLEVVGDSATPIAMSGQHVLCESAPPHNGDMAVVRYEDESGHDRCVLKRFAQVGRMTILSCIAEPAAHKPIEIPSARVLESYVVVGVLFRR
jgi:transcriptional regulator with XRE-family HTH domain